jgi:hypothetical protein
VVGGSGVLFYYVDRFRNRSRLRVRILREVVGTSPGHLVEFEAQNLGTLPMSLEPTVTMTGLDLKLRRRRYTMAVSSHENRTLPPHAPKSFGVLCDPDPAFGFLWYRTYTFRATRGGARRVHLRYIDGPPLSAVRSFFEIRLMRWAWTRDLLLKRVGSDLGPLPPGSPSGPTGLPI